MRGVYEVLKGIYFRQPLDIEDPMSDACGPSYSPVSGFVDSVIVMYLRLSSYAAFRVDLHGNMVLGFANVYGIEYSTVGTILANLLQYLCVEKVSRDVKPQYSN